MAAKTDAGLMVIHSGIRRCWYLLMELPQQLSPYSTLWKLTEELETKKLDNIEVVLEPVVFSMVTTLWHLHDHLVWCRLSCCTFYRFQYNLCTCHRKYLWSGFCKNKSIQNKYLPKKITEYWFICKLIMYVWKIQINTTTCTRNIKEKALACELIDKILLWLVGMWCLCSRQPWTAVISCVLVSPLLYSP